MTACSRAFFLVASLAACAIVHADLADDIGKLASASACSQRQWHGRGLAARGYVSGVARTYARALCHPERAEVAAASVAADPAKQANDALLAYKADFARMNIRNGQAGVDALRSTYALLIGLGMRESSGLYCEGRDTSMCFAEADSAEAGLFQTSYGASASSPALRELMRVYAEQKRDCLLSAFGGASTCRVRTSSNADCPTATSDVAGTGPGADWQHLTKSCPAFATEYGAVILRTRGGSGKEGTPRGEFGPIRSHAVELVPQCLSLLREIEARVASEPHACDAL